MRFEYDHRSSERLRSNPKRAIGFDEVQEIFQHPYYEDFRPDDPEQLRAVGWVGGRLYSLIHGAREDTDG